MTFLISGSPTISSEGTYTPFVLRVGTPELPAAEALRLEEDLSVTVDWARIEAYAAISPVGRSTITNFPPDINERCLVHALLALRDGRVKEITQ